MEAEKTADAPVVAAEKPAEAPAIKLDDARVKKAESTAPAPSIDKADAKPAEKAAKAVAPPEPPKSAARNLIPAKPSVPLGVRVIDIAEVYGYRAAGVLVILGVGWIIGANSFDNHANERRVAEALRALDTKIELVSAKVVTGSEVAALKRNLDDMKLGLDGARKTTAAITDLRNRFDASERTRTASADALMERVGERVTSLGRDQGERLDKLAERLDGIEKQLASQIPTASIPPQASAAPAKTAEPVQIPGVTLPMAQPRNEGRTTVERSRLPENGYVLREVYNGIAVVESRRGLMEVGPGDTLPGAGRVRSIERRNRQWVVVTSNGVIDTNGY